MTTTATPMTKKRFDFILSHYPGATCEITDMLDGSFRVEALAPDGFEWSEGGVVSLVSDYFPDFGDKRGIAYQDLADRIRFGLEPRTDQ